MPTAKMDGARFESPHSAKKDSLLVRIPWGDSDSMFKSLGTKRVGMVHADSAHSAVGFTDMSHPASTNEISLPTKVAQFDELSPKVQPSTLEAAHAMFWSSFTRAPCADKCENPAQRTCCADRPAGTKCSQVLFGQVCCKKFSCLRGRPPPKSDHLSSDAAGWLGWGFTGLE